MNTTVPFQAQKPIFHKLENIADMAKQTCEEREYYHVSLDSLRTNLAVMEHERNEGRAEGLVEDQAELLQRIISRGRSIEDIADLLGYTKEEIRAVIERQSEGI